MIPEPTTEIWKEHPRLGFLISTFGNVRRQNRKNDISKPNKNSYKSYKSFLVHRLVYETFVGVIPDDMIINHKNGKKNDNRLANLELATKSENSKHAVTLGLKWDVGENSHHAKLTKKQVIEIYQQCVAGIPDNILAQKYIITEKTISDIRNKKSWKNTFVDFFGRDLEKIPHIRRKKTHKTKSECFSIMKELFDDDVGVNDVAHKYNMSKSTISAIRTGKIWKDVYEKYRKSNPKKEILFEQLQQTLPKTITQSPTEIWKTYRNCSISNFGNVIGVHGRPICIVNDPTKYVSFFSQGLHRIVYQLFGGEIPENYQINHIDCRKNNNHIDNLECVTASRNFIHALENNRIVHASGEKHCHVKLSETQIFEIYELIKGGLGDQEISKKFNISSKTISDIRFRKHWKKQHDLFFKGNIIRSPRKYKHSREKMFRLLNDITENELTNKELSQKYELHENQISKIIKKEMWIEIWKLFEQN